MSPSLIDTLGLPSHCHCWVGATQLDHGARNYYLEAEDRTIETVGTGDDDNGGRVYAAGAVHGSGGAEHILFFGGVDSDGRPLASLAVLTLAGEVPSNVWVR